MMTDSVDAVAKWKARYEHTRGAFQEKHVYVTRLEIRVDELEKTVKAIGRLEKRLVECETTIAKLKQAAGRRKPVEEKPAEPLPEPVLTAAA